MIIRSEAPDDRAAIHELVSAAFGEAAEAELVDELRRSGDLTLSLVAVERGRIIGHIALSRMKAPFPALALAPLAVAPSRQRQGVGSALVREAARRAGAEGWSAIFVLGDPGYYRRFGFQVQAAGSFTSPYAGPHFMALALTSGLPNSGELRHAPAFAALD